MSPTHVDAATSEVLGKSISERMAWFQTEFWIKYDAAEKVMTALEDLIAMPRRGRMAGYVVSAETNNGKSRIAARLLARHPIYPTDDEECRLIAPVLLHVMRPAPSESVLVDRLLGELGVPSRPTYSITERREMLVSAMRDAQVKLLAIDELQMMLGARQENRRVLMDALRYICNQVPVPLVAFSTPRGTQALATSDEMINRLRPLSLPAWKLDPGFQSLLASFELRLPLQEPSGLSRAKLATLIHALTEGYIGEVYDLLEAALREALHSGQEHLDEALIRRLAWVPPSDRKRTVKSQG